MSSSVAAVLGALFLLVAQACTTPTRYRLQLKGNPHAQAGRACIRACNDGREDRFECYATCPGVTVAESRECTSTDRPPNAICADQRDSSANVIIGIGFAAVLGLFLLVGVLIEVGAIVPVGRGDPSP